MGLAGDDKVKEDGGEGEMRGVVWMEGGRRVDGGWMEGGGGMDVWKVMRG